MTLPKALLFDVFGTLVDWRTSIAREAGAILAPSCIEMDWHGFADAWRGRYDPSMAPIRAGTEPYVSLDILHRRNLDHVLPRFAVPALPEPVVAHLTLAWHRLDAWPDVAAGLHRLREKFLIAPCSNGNIALMVALARRNDFPWDAILGAEIAQDFKPKPCVYLASAAALGVAPQDCMMVAAHSSDLAAASALGMKTAHIARPDEHGPGKSEARPTVPVDHAASSLTDLAGELGA